MSFQIENNKKEVNNKDLKKIPLVEENTNELLSRLQTIFFEFNKNLEDLKEYNQALNTMSVEQYNLVKGNMHKKITTFPESMSNISSIINQLNKLEIKDLVIRNRVKDQVKVVNDKMQIKKLEVDKVLMEIISKENTASRLNNVKENSLTYNHDLTNKTSINKESFKESKVEIDEIVENNEYLNRRNDQLEEIKKISSQIKEISNLMTSDVKKQGDDLGRIEEIVVETKDNAIKAEKNIEEAEKVSRGDSRRICFISFLVVMLTTSVVLLIYFVFLK